MQYRISPTVKPEIGVPINKGHHLYRDLELYYRFTGIDELIDAGRQQNHGAKYAAPSVGSGPNGRVTTFAENSSQRYNLTSMTFADTNGITLQWKCIRTGTANHGMLSGDGTSGDFIWMNTGVNLIYRNSVVSDTTFTVDTAFGSWRTYTLAISDAGANHSADLYIDGKFVENQTGSIGSMVIDRIGNAYTATTYNFTGSIDHWILWSRTLSAGEILESARNPYGVFHPTSTRTYYFGPAVAATGNITSHLPLLGVG